MSAEFEVAAPLVSDNAGGRAETLMEGARKKLGFVPNMYRGMAIEPSVLDTYLHGYELFREGPFSAPEQEVVFLTISRLNDCSYCTAAHSMLAINVSKLSEANTHAIRDGKPLDDPKLQALHDFTKVMFETRGKPTKAQGAAFKDAGYDDTHVLSVILASAVKTLSNWSNHVTHPEVDDAFAAFRVTEAA